MQFNCTGKLCCRRQNKGDVNHTLNFSQTLSRCSVWLLTLDLFIRLLITTFPAELTTFIATESCLLPLIFKVIPGVHFANKYVEQLDEGIHCILCSCYFNMIILFYKLWRNHVCFVNNAVIIYNNWYV